MSNLLKTKQNSKVNLALLSDTELLELAQVLNVLDEKAKYNYQEFLYTPYATNPGYGKHLKFFNAGAAYKERALIAGNRTSKTWTACVEMSYHLNGKYPEGWKGKKFHGPIEAWSIGKTHETTRDILQKYLYGNFLDPGSGFIPRSDIIDRTVKSGIPHAIQDVYIRHYTDGIEDGISHLGFKSYVQGVEAFMGTEQHAIHMDEEPTTPSIYSECLTRTMTTQGVIMCTFTPLLGLSDVLMSFLPGGRFPLGGYGEVIAYE